MNTQILRQHLIDPEVCIRCNTCEEKCPVKAISHDRRNYVVNFDVCDGCGDCLPPCPTGAIDSWRQVRQPYTVDEQLKWDELPADQKPNDDGVVPVDVAALTERAGQASAQARPPWSAAHPYLGLYGI